MTVLRYGAYSFPYTGIRINCFGCERLIVIPQEADAGDFTSTKVEGVVRIVDARRRVRIHQCGTSSGQAWDCLECGLKDVDVAMYRRRYWEPRTEYATPTCPRCYRPLRQRLVA